MNCKTVQPLLSEYIDNRLSARDTWEVDRHLAGCNECTRLLNEMRRTVALLQESPRLEVPAEFMQRLQDRLATVEPEPARGAWKESIGRLFLPRVLPAWGAALAACGLAAVLLLPPSHPPATVLQQGGAVRAAVQKAASQNVAISASDPLADLGAANLTAHASADAAPDPASQID